MPGVRCWSTGTGGASLERATASILAALAADADPTSPLVLARRCGRDDDPAHAVAIEARALEMATLRRRGPAALATTRSGRGALRPRRSTLRRRPDTATPDDRPLRSRAPGQPRRRRHRPTWSPVHSRRRLASPARDRGRDAQAPWLSRSDLAGVAARRRTALAAVTAGRRDGRRRHRFDIRRVLGPRGLTPADRSDPGRVDCGCGEAGDALRSPGPSISRQIAPTSSTRRSDCARRCGVPARTSWISGAPVPGGAIGAPRRPTRHARRRVRGSVVLRVEAPAATRARSSSWSSCSGRRKMAAPRRLRRHGSHSERRSDAELAVERRRLEARLDRAEEAGGVRTVDDAVVVRQREVHVRARPRSRPCRRP